MKTLRILICLTIALLPLVAKADVKFTGKAPSSVAVGDKFQLTYTLTDADSRDIRLPEINGFDILMGPSTSTSSSISIINGQMSQSKSTTFTYILKATQEGNHTIQGASIVVDGDKLTSNSLTINVGAAGSAQNNQNEQYSQQQLESGIIRQSTTSDGKTPDIFMTQTLSKSSVYIGESVELITKFYTRVDIEKASVSETPKLTEFVTQDLEASPTYNREVVNGVVYTSKEAFRQVLIPQKSGKLTIEPIEIDFVIKKRVGGGGGGFFGDFFAQTQLVQQKVKSKSVTLNVKELPADKPAGFSGGVGNFTFKASVSPLEVKADNSVQVKISISGNGNLKLISLPRPQFHSDFDTFDPKEINDVKSTSSGYNGTKSAEYLIIPRHEGEFTIPELKFVYFNLSKGKYETLTQGPFTIKVEKNENSQNNNVVSFSGGSREQVQYIGKDLRYLRLNPEPLKPSKTFFLFSALFFICLFVPLAILVFFFILYRKKINDNANMDKVKMRKANRQAKRRLKQAARYIKENKREQFFDEVMRALWGYLSDKLTLPLSDLTKDNAKEEMQRHNIDEDAANEFMNLLDSCEFARYAPADISDSMDNIYNKAFNVIGRLESNNK